MFSNRNLTVEIYLVQNENSIKSFFQGPCLMDSPISHFALSFYFISTLGQFLKS